MLNAKQLLPIGGGILRRTTTVRDHRVGSVLSVDDPGNPGTPQPGSTIPTDLKMELMLGANIVKATDNDHILLQSEYVGEVWQVRLTRENRGGTAEQKYIIEAQYPSILPILTRELAVTAFQRAFDSNWNQHPYIAIEMKNEIFTVTFDEDFRQLYGLTNYRRDLSSRLYSIPNFTVSTRFSMGIAQHPITVNGVHDAPVMTARAKLSIGPVLTFQFFLDTWGGGAGFTPVAKLEGISDNIPLVDVRAKIQDAAQDFANKLPRQSFATSFTPWLIGEPGRELHEIVVVPGNKFRVGWVGKRKPPSTDPVISDGGIGPSGPPPVLPDYLFDTPDETPPPPLPSTEDPLGRRLTTTPGRLESIQNIVVLMLENRSFDQVLGYLSREAGRTDVDGLSADDQRHREDFPENIVRVPHRATTTAWPGFDKPGPIHHTDGVEKQMGLTLMMDKFVANFDERAHGDNRLLDLIKAYFGPEQLPAYKALTDEFAICDQWFTPHAGPTWPNRFITFTGNLNIDHRGTVEKDNPNLHELMPSQPLTIFDHLTEHGQSWRVYEHGYSFLRLYGRYTFETQRIVDFKHTTTGFVADARAGRLPRLSFIEPDYIDLPPGNDDHPPADMADGQKLVATVVTALMDSPQWDNTLLVITYDEHGGFYDHVRPVDGPAFHGGFVRRGPRVPTFVVSPWVGRGAVGKTLYDHTSIISTVMRGFCSPHPPKISPRADAANDLRDLIQPTRRPRADYNAVYSRLAAIRDQPRNPPVPPPQRLKASPDRDDFHAVMRYVRSFT
jgi:phospholipase C